MHILDLLFDYLHVFVNIFAGGRSTIKVYLFIFYLCILGIVTIYKKKYPHKFNKHTQFFRLFFISTALLFLIGIITQLYLYFVYGIPWGETLIVFNNHEISSSRIWHIHTLKGAMALLISPFSSGVFTNADVGLAFIGIIPTFFYFITLFLLAISIYSSIRLYVAIQTHSYSNKQIALLWICYSIFSFSILKNTIDGGILNVETIPAILGMYFLFYFSEEIIHKLMHMYTALLCVLSLVYLGAILTKNDGGFSFFFYHFIGMATFTLFLLCLYFYIRSHHISTAFFIGSILLCIIGVYITTIKDIESYSYKHSYLTAKEPLLITSYFPIKHTGVHLSETIGTMNIYKTDSSAHISVTDIIEQAQVPANFYPISIPYFTCISQKHLEEVRFRITTKNRFINFSPLYLNQSQYYKIIKIEAALADNRHPDIVTYDVTMLIESCLSQKLEIIQQIFSQVHLDFFIMSRALEEPLN